MTLRLTMAQALVRFLDAQWVERDGQETKFVAGDPYADCNADGALTVADFGCFQTKFVVGCP